MTACRNTCRLLALVGVGVLGLLTLVGSGGGGGDEGGSPPKAWGTAELIETENFFGAVIAGAGGGFYFKSYLPNTVAPKSFPQIDGEIHLG